MVEEYDVLVQLINSNNLHDFSQELGAIADAEQRSKIATQLLYYALQLESDLAVQAFLPSLMEFGAGLSFYMLRDGKYYSSQLYSLPIADLSPALSGVALYPVKSEEVAVSPFDMLVRMEKPERLVALIDATLRRSNWPADEEQSMFSARGIPHATTWFAMALAAQKILELYRTDRDQYERFRAVLHDVAGESSIAAVSAQCLSNFIGLRDMSLLQRFVRSLQKAGVTYDDKPAFPTSREEIAKAYPTETPMMRVLKQASCPIELITSLAMVLLNAGYICSDEEFEAMAELGIEADLVVAQALQNCHEAKLFSENPTQWAALLDKIIEKRPHQAGVIAGFARTHALCLSLASIETLIASPTVTPELVRVLLAHPQRMQPDSSLKDFVFLQDYFSQYPECFEPSLAVDLLQRLPLGGEAGNLFLKVLAHAITKHGFDDAHLIGSGGNYLLYPDGSQKDYLKLSYADVWLLELAALFTKNLDNRGDILGVMALLLQRVLDIRGGHFEACCEVLMIVSKQLTRIPRGDEPETEAAQRRHILGMLLLPLNTMLGSGCRVVFGTGSTALPIPGASKSPPQFALDSGDTQWLSAYFKCVLGKYPKEADVPSVEELARLHENAPQKLFPHQASVGHYATVISTEIYGKSDKRSVDAAHAVLLRCVFLSPEAELGQTTLLGTVKQEVLDSMRNRIFYIMSMLARRLQLENADPKQTTNGMRLQSLLEQDPAARRLLAGLMLQTERSDAANRGNFRRLKDYVEQHPTSQITDLILSSHQYSAGLMSTDRFAMHRASKHTGPSRPFKFAESSLSEKQQGMTKKLVQVAQTDRTLTEKKATEILMQHIATFLDDQHLDVASVCAHNQTPVKGGAQKRDLHDSLTQPVSPLPRSFPSVSTALTQSSRDSAPSAQTTPTEEARSPAPPVKRCNSWSTPLRGGLWAAPAAPKAGLRRVTSFSEGDVAGDAREPGRRLSYNGT